MGFLDRLPELNPETFDQETQKKDGLLKVVFFWGPQCPNCEMAKIHLEEHAGEAFKAKINWFHVNAYSHSDLGIRFGLHGIPTFLLFRNGSLLGRVTSFPGWEPFAQVLEKYSQ